ncbi:P-loop containing nucleoside triphosphate hydrolase protein [Neolentinus lepideus HHB14362 ss-1]|uniref:p-loop containing nucleoside triphosphate hydrolase protein n=1 Tax=Neolentinus lepideus HHB14362 ss-1 TaxID=1314782 RepID=A0A165Q6H8_9AGAM|nr:P-loop containing nucleoside triphosphate hydrolase protein [Neolentinus lepideus HHB14362 ss-1]
MDQDQHNGNPSQESSTTSKEGETTATFSPAADPRQTLTAQRGRLKTLNWGIFTVVYEACAPVYWNFSSFVEGAESIRRDLRAVRRLFRDVFKLAPITLLLHLFATLWGAFLPALSLYLYSLLLQIIMTGIVRGCIEPLDVKLILVIFILSSVIYVAVDWLLDTTALLRSHLRAHFIPLFVTASLSLDLQALQDPNVSSSLPKEYLFEDTAPGWDTISEGCRLVGIVVNFLSHVIVVLSVLPKDDLKSRTCPLMFIAHIALHCLRYLHGVQRRPFIFYSDNPIYQRLGILYRMVFTSDMRESLASDGGALFVAHEYQRANQALGVGRNDPSHLRYAIPKPWYTTILHQLLMELPLVSFFCIEIWKFTPASLISVLLVWQGQNSLRSSVHFGDVCAAFRRACLSAVTLSDALKITNPRKGTSAYPNAGLRVTDGASVSFHNVSFSYPTFNYHDTLPHEAKTVLHDIAFDILPGTLTLVVGKNGSGKSTLLKLMCGLFRPQHGEVLIDTMSMCCVRENDLRRSVCHVPQEPRLYPLSLRENLHIGLDHVPNRSSLLRAAEQAGILDLVARLPSGFDTFMGSVTTAYHGVTAPLVDGVSENDLCPRLNQEYMRHFKVGPALSRGEKQRLALARTILRLENSDVKLLLVDEPTSALDPVAEMDFYAKLRQCSRGRTMVAVAHHFAQLARQADMIL